jgi:hypothetical protein
MLTIARSWPEVGWPITSPGVEDKIAQCQLWSINYDELRQF